MRELLIGGNVIGIRGGVVCRLFFFQEFAEEIEGSFSLLAKGQYGLVMARLAERGAAEKDIVEIIMGDSSVYERLSIGVSELEEIIAAAGGELRAAALRVIWAMSKAERFAAGLSTPAYCRWVMEHGGLDFDSAPDVLGELNAEIYDSFHVAADGGAAEGNAGAKAENISAASVALGKQLGFSLSELNEMSVQGFLDVVRAYAGDGKGGGAGGGETKAREAAQGDIDWLLG